VLLSESVPHPFGIAVHDDLVYWTDWVTHSIESANKLDGSGRRVVVGGLEDLMDIHVFNRQRPTGERRRLTLGYQYTPCPRRKEDTLIFDITLPSVEIL